jgi:hypothetical protein
MCVQQLAKHLEKQGIGGKAAKANAIAEDDDEDGELDISLPFNVQHKYHVQVDPSTGTGFAGLCWNKCSIAVPQL